MKLTDINDIKKLLSEEGFRFSKSMGQNFLTAAWVPERIAEEANLDEGTGVLEIGPGIGCLTEQLSMRAGTSEKICSSAAWSTATSVTSPQQRQ